MTEPTSAAPSAPNATRPRPAAPPPCDCVGAGAASVPVELAEAEPTVLDDDDAVWEPVDARARS